MRTVRSHPTAGLNALLLSGSVAWAGWVNAVASLPQHLWQRAGLSIKFAALSAVILLFGMFLVGQWMSAQVSTATVQSRAAATVLQLNSIVEPRVQALATDAPLTDSDQLALDSLVATELGKYAALGFRIWTRETVVYSDRKDLIGRHQGLTGERAQAWSGEVVAHLIPGTTVQDDDLDADFHPAQASGEPLLEIYAPVRQSGTNRVIALTETYQRVPELRSNLWWAQVGAWIMVANIGLIVFAAQLSIVHSGTLTIEQQRTQLNERITALTKMLTENSVLRQANMAGIRATDVNERHLRRIGADLHDGPLQLIGATMFRLDSLEGIVSDAEPGLAADAREDITVIREAIGASMIELRDLAAGFMLPEIDGLSVSRTIETAAKRHERRTGQQVRVAVTGTMPTLATPFNVCLYRFTQEALNNAFRHCKDSDTVITIQCHLDTVSVSVRDHGPGFDSRTIFSQNRGLGLFGLRDRIEALGGTLSIVSDVGAGTTLTARFCDVKQEIET
jgi:signal transduction histidine kinase